MVDQNPAREITRDVNPQYVYVVQADSSSDGVSLLDYWQAIMKRKWMIILIILLMTSIVGLYLWTMKPSYIAAVSMLYVRGDGGGSEAASSGGSNEEGGRELSQVQDVSMGSIEESTAILESRIFTVKFIKDENLLPILFASKWDINKKEWRLIAGEQPPDMWDAYRLFDEKIRSVTTDRDSGLTIISIEWGDPQLAADWANKLVTRLNSTLKSHDLGLSKKSLVYLKKTLAKTPKVYLKTKLNSLIDYHQTIIMFANIRSEYAFKIIDPAVKPKYEVWTKLKRILVTLVSALTALMLGIFLALVMDFLDRQHKKDGNDAQNDEKAQGDQLYETL